MANPFFYIEANTLKPEELIKYFIDEHNHNDFIQSTKNIFLIGERGSGKSMILMYNSFPVQKILHGLSGKESSNNIIGIYAQITPTLFEKREFELIEGPLKRALLSEHFLTLVIALKLIGTITNSCKDIIQDADKIRLRKKLKSIFEFDVSDTEDPFEELADKLKWYQKDTQEILQKINEEYPGKTLSFFSFLLPLIDTLKSLDCFRNIHFNFLIDDAQNLNDYQKKLLSSWVAYRDHSDYSVKISITRPEEYLFLTTNDSPILEGHDYIARYTEGRFQNQLSDFGILANKIIKKRIALLGIGDIEPNIFFPINQSFAKDLDDCKEIVRRKAVEKYPDGDAKKIADFVYKYTRAEYFRNRDPQANKAPYSGFEIISHLSTGIIRNLLEPCSLMFDTAKDRYDIKDRGFIEPEIQETVISELCQQKWGSITAKMPTSVVGCTITKAQQIKNLLERIGDLFRNRLLDPLASEPRAISFTISALSDLLQQEQEDLFDLLRIARSHGLVFKRLSSAKEAGKFEIYYTPHRMLWPIKGLDPVGQHARVSIKAKYLYDAAIGNKEIKYDRTQLEDENGGIVIQKSLFEQY